MMSLQNNVNTSVNTPGKNADSNKRNIEAIWSPSDGAQGDHLNAPEPLRRKASLSDLKEIDSNVSVQGKNYDICDLVREAVCSPTVIKAISDAVVPSLNEILKNTFEPINTKLEAQSKELAMLHTKLDFQTKSINNVKAENISLRRELDESKDRIETLEREHDEAEQYGRRTSLRFHRVPLLGEIKSYNTDNEIVKICNEKMSVNPPITHDDIERSHILGSMKDGKAQIICKFKAWKVKNNVYMNKKNLKNHKTDDFNVFVTEDLTRKRQFIVQQLNAARKDDKIDSFWTVDGKIFLKEKSTSNYRGMKRSVRTIDEIEHLLPDPDAEMIDNPWGNLHPKAANGSKNDLKSLQSEVNVD